MPAQKAAGVVKSAKGKEGSMEQILKKLEEGGNLLLSESECRKLCGYIGNLKQSAKDGVFYRDSLTAEVLRLSAAVQPDISRETMESVAKSLNISQLKEVKTAFEKQKQQAYAPVPQLLGKQSNARISYAVWTRRLAWIRVRFPHRHGEGHGEQRKRSSGFRTASASRRDPCGGGMASGSGWRCYKRARVPRQRH